MYDELVNPTSTKWNPTKCTVGFDTSNQIVGHLSSSWIM